MRVLALLLLLAAPAQAQTGSVALQARALALKVQAQAAQVAATATSANNQAQAAYSAAANAQTAVAGKADAAALAAKADASAIPPVCSTVPAMDTTNGSAGSATGCTPRTDASRPANVQIATATGGGSIVTASDGGFSGIWPRAWASAPGYAHAEIYGSTTPYLCMVSAATVSAVSGKCTQLIATTLPGVLTSLFGLVVTPFQATPAGLTVRVVGRQ